MGFVLSPDFQESNLAFAYYTYEDSTGQFNLVVTIRLADNVWKEESLLLDKIPGNSWHDGGRIKIGPDEKLYIKVGDAYERSISQDPTALGGKILRINMDGSIPNVILFRIHLYIVTAIKPTRNYLVTERNTIC